MALLDDEEWKAFIEYDKQEPTEQELEDQEEAKQFYLGHEWKKFDDAIVRFWKF